MNHTENLFLNFHAHQQLPAEDEIVIQSKFLQEDLAAPKAGKIFFTAGLHPWHADTLSNQQIKDKLETLIAAKQIIAIGETGLDKLKGPDLTMQRNVLKIHIEIADKYNLPVIIHSVKSHNEILKLRIDSGSKTPWAIHHFNGSKQMAWDFIEHGFYLSLCHHINNPKSKLNSYLGELPIEKIFLETDDFEIEIKELYNIASQKLNINIELLKHQLIKNFNTFLNGY